MARAVAARAMREVKRSEDEEARDAETHTRRERHACMHAGGQAGRQAGSTGREQEGREAGRYFDCRTQRVYVSVCLSER
eukprot:684849-Hanusia_phi.AAC.2